MEHEPLTRPDRFGLIADDLTGACDAGVHFRRLSWHVQVLLDPTAPLPEADLTVLCTHSRSAPPERARQTVASCAQRLGKAGRRLLYKKLDSTLHGNLGAEIDAILDQDANRFALVCPAFPDMGRHYERGELLLGNERRPSGKNLLLACANSRDVQYTTSPWNSSEALRDLSPNLSERNSIVAQRFWPSTPKRRSNCAGSRTRPWNCSQTRCPVDRPVWPGNSPLRYQKTL